jgi:hypothetical protein
MPLWVKVVEGVVVKCWDTPPPENDDGWREAIEVRPAVTNGREVYGEHSFDLTKTPVEIVWPVVAVSVEERKEHLRAVARANFSETVNEQVRRELSSKPDESYDPVIVNHAGDVRQAALAAIEAAATHDDLDQVV